MDILCIVALVPVIRIADLEFNSSTTHCSSKHDLYVTGVSCSDKSTLGSQSNYIQHNRKRDNTTELMVV